MSAPSKTIAQITERVALLSVIAAFGHPAITITKDQKPFYRLPPAAFVNDGMSRFTQNLQLAVNSKGVEYLPGGGREFSVAKGVILRIWPNAVVVEDADGSQMAWSGSEWRHSAEAAGECMAEIVGCLARLTSAA